MKCAFCKREKVFLDEACRRCAGNLVKLVLNRARASDPEALQFKTLRSLIGGSPYEHA